MDEFIKSFADWLKEKTSSTLYFAFLLSFGLTQWKMLFVLFSEDRIPDGLSRLSYAVSHVSYWDYPSWRFPYVEELLEHLSMLFIPVIVTYIIVYHIPKLYNGAHATGIFFFNERKEEFYRQEFNSQKRISGILRNIGKELDQQRATRAAIQQYHRDTPQEVQWEDEFTSLKNADSLDYKNLEHVADLLIHPSVHEDDDKRKKLVYPQIIGLVTFDFENNASITEKGRYFVKRFLESKKDSKSLNVVSRWS